MSDLLFILRSKSPLVLLAVVAMVSILVGFSGSTCTDSLPVRPALLGFRIRFRQRLWPNHVSWSGSRGGRTFRRLRQDPAFFRGQPGPSPSEYAFLEPEPF